MRAIVVWLVLASASAHANPVPASEPPPPPPPLGPSSPPPAPPQRLWEVMGGIGFGAVYGDPDIPPCQTGDCDTPIGLTADLGIGLRLTPLHVGVRMHAHAQVIDGAIFGDNQLNELALLGSVELELPVRFIKVIGGLGIATAWYEWTEPGFLVDEAKSESLGVGPIAIAAGRIRLGRLSRLASWGIEARVSLARLDETLSGFHVLAAFW